MHSANSGPVQMVSLCVRKEHSVTLCVYAYDCICLCVCLNSIVGQQ